jgi:phosphoglycolate phosphatase
MMGSNQPLFASEIAQLLDQPVAAVLFDLDGTLIDSVPDLTAAIDTMLQSLGKASAGEEKVKSWVGNGASALVKRALIDADLLVGSDLLESNVYSKAYPIFEFAYEQRLTQATGLYSGVEQVLAQLQSHGIKLGLITNKPRRFTLPLIRALNIQHYFQDVLCGDDLAFKKPHPLPVTTALENLAVSAQQTVLVGDSISDVKSARAAGVKSVAVTYGYNHGLAITDSRNEVLADCFIDQMQQLLA